MRNCSVLYDVEPQAEEQFYKFVQNAGEWRRKQQVLQAEKSQMSANMVEKDNELSGKLMQIKQARQYLQEERAARIKAEARAEAAEKQLRLIQDLVFSDRGHQTLSNDTLVKLRTLDRNPSSASNYASQYGGSPQVSSILLETLVLYQNATDSDLIPRLGVFLALESIHCYCTHRFQKSRKIKK